jgi:hypothetical protein
MAADLRLEAVVQPDGKIELTVPELFPSQRVTVTIEVPDTRALEEPEARQSTEPRHYTALELMKLPREERDRILEAAAAAAEEEYAANPALSEFDAFGEDDLYDDHSK